MLSDCQPELAACEQPSDRMRLQNSTYAGSIGSSACSTREWCASVASSASRSLIHCMGPPFALGRIRGAQPYAEEGSEMQIGRCRRPRGDESSSTGLMTRQKNSSNVEMLLRGHAHRRGAACNLRQALRQPVAFRI